MLVAYHIGLHPVYVMYTCMWWCKNITLAETCFCQTCLNRCWQKLAFCVYISVGDNVPASQAYLNLSTSTQHGIDLLYLAQGVRN